MCRPAAQLGNGTVGSRSKTSPMSPAPKMTSNTRRITRTKSPSFRKNPNERAACGERRAVTVKPATAISSSRTIGLVVRVAAAPSASDQAHHAPGMQRSCGSRELTVVVAASGIHRHGCPRRARQIAAPPMTTTRTPPTIAVNSSPLLPRLVDRNDASEVGCPAAPSGTTVGSDTADWGCWRRRRERARRRDSTLRRARAAGVDCDGERCRRRRRRQCRGVAARAVCVGVGARRCRRRAAAPGRCGTVTAGAHSVFG